MNKLERITKKIEADKDLMKSIGKVNHMDTESFIRNAERYIKAIKEGRVICNIAKVSNSGMSRNIKFLECSGSVKNGFRYYNFFALMKAMGYTVAGDTDTFRIGGCGMDMIFHTNYTIIHRLQRLGFISKKECERLAQRTPSVI